MGNRYKEEKPFAFYDPERDWEGQRQQQQQQAPRNNRSAPVSPRGAPMPSPPGLYPEPDVHGYNRSGLLTSPREKPFGHFDPELRDGERQRQGMSGPLDSDPGYRGLGSDHLAPPNGSYGRGASEPGYANRGAPVARSYPPPPNPNFAGVPGAPTRPYPPPSNPNFAGIPGAPDARPYPPSTNPNSAGVSGAPAARPYPPSPSPEFAGVSGRGRVSGSYGDLNGRNPGLGGGDAGYPRPEMPGRGGAPLGMGPGSAVPAMGDGRYVYGGIPRRLEMEEEDGAVPPAPISSEHAHQVYASVFSDPVYGGAGQLNSRAGYHEEPEKMRQVHHREDVLRHPDQY